MHDARINRADPNVEDRDFGGSFLRREEIFAGRKNAPVGAFDRTRRRINDLRKVI